MDPAWVGLSRVLLVRLDNLGDVLVTTPAIRAVRHSLPQAHLTLLCSPVGAQVGRLNPDIDEVIEYQAPWMDPWSQLECDPARELHLVEELRSAGFDAAIIFTSFRQSCVAAAYLCYLAGIPLRLGASVEGPGSLLTTRVKHDGDYTGEFPHEVMRSIELVASVGMQTDDLHLRLRVPEIAHHRSATILSAHAAGGPRIVVHPGCSMPARTYPTEGFGAIVDRLICDFNATVFLTGTESEAPLVRTIQDSLKSTRRSRTVSLTGTIDFATMCGLIEACDLTICSNTGPAHVSAAVGTPVVTLFALTNPPHQWSPWMVPFRQLFQDVSCRICYRRVCPYHQECLTLVPIDEIVTAAGELLNESGTERGAPEAVLGAAYERRAVCRA